MAGSAETSNIAALPAIAWLAALICFMLAIRVLLDVCYVTGFGRKLRCKFWDGLSVLRDRLAKARMPSASTSLLKSLARMAGRLTSSRWRRNPASLSRC